MKIIALDPGGTTGYAVGNWNEEKGILYVTASQAKWTHSMLYSQLVTASPDWIIYESFEYRNRAREGLELISCELIGVIELYAQQHDVSQCRQTAGTGKGFYTDKKLKEGDVWRSDAVPHGMDAVRHLLHWYTFGEGFQYNYNGFERA